MPSTVYYLELERKDVKGFASEKFLSFLDKANIAGPFGDNDFIGIKLHFGEHQNTKHISPAWIKALAGYLDREVKGLFLTDSNVLYRTSKRRNSIEHLKLAYEHGFDIKDTGVPAIIADGLLGRDYKEIEVDKKHFSKVKIASAIVECDGMVCVSHATGHMMTGCAAAMKNLGMGCASKQGKYEQHSGVVPDIVMAKCVGCGLCVEACDGSVITLKDGKACISKDKCTGCGKCVITCRHGAVSIKWSETLENMQEKMVEYAYGVNKALKSKISYLNFLINVTKDCDCLTKDTPSIVRDLGILASLDPVSIDKATIDLVNAACGKDKFKEIYPEVQWSHQFDYAEKIGLGSTNYKLERI